MPRYLGQHFLADEQVLQAIVDAISAMVTDFSIDEMREIGPGQGALTQHIFKFTSKFLCYEKDETMQKYLGQFLQPEQVVWGDVLETPLPDPLLQGDGECLDTTMVVGNLPYYITSPIFRKFFVPSPPAPLPEGEGSHLIVDSSIVGGVFLIQKEVADKIKTDAKKKSYLRRLLNNRYTIEYLFTVAPESFDPPPKIDSAVVQLKREKNEQLNNEKYVRMLDFLDLVSPYKRKTLGKIQKMLAKKGIEIVIPERYLIMRLEELGREEMRNILM